ncbi:MAG TPA: universal stress protein [Flavipsychrobacter sp.]|nr:universal stress protein [Flavipsychrobacter sp.]
MLHILVATDFSDVADKAIDYACGLARDFRASVTVLHSFTIPVTFSDTPMPVMPVDEGKEIAKERMKEVVDNLQNTYPGILINSKIMFGDITDCIEEYAEEAKPWLIILGNSATEDAPLWLGSNVLSALKNLKHTVVAIPPQCVYTKPEKLCFACDFKHIADHLQTENLLHLVTQTGAQLHVLNVDHNNKNFTAEWTLDHTELQEALSKLNPVYHFVEKENVEEGIQEFIEANQMDWLIIVSHQYSFFESLFHKSHTKAIMKMVNIPLLAMRGR